MAEANRNIHARGDVLSRAVKAV
ncbi:hypothetical protein Tco_1551200, partial [Tanacetum coccineum]